MILTMIGTKENNVKIILSILIILQANIVYADCNWSTDIIKKEDGYLYTTECHKKTGKLVADIADYEKETEALRKAIELKDLALVKSDEQLMLWREETYNQHERLLKIQSVSDKERWMWFAIGIVVMGGATYAAVQLR